jgi:hypothetical protein
LVRKPLCHCLAGQTEGWLTDAALHGQTTVSTAWAYHHGRSGQRRFGSRRKDVQVGLLAIDVFGMQLVDRGCDTIERGCDGISQATAGRGAPSASPEMGEDSLAAPGVR